MQGCPSCLTWLACFFCTLAQLSPASLLMTDTLAASFGEYAEVSAAAVPHTFTRHALHSLTAVMASLPC